MTASPHVLFHVGADRFAGAEESLRSLLIGLPSSVGVTLAGPHRPVLDLVAAGRPGCRIATVPSLASKADRGRARRVWRALAELEPDVVHLNKVDVGDLRYVELLLALRRTPVVSVVHHVERPATATVRAMARRLARRSRAVVAVSGRNGAELEAILGLRPGAVTVIPNALPAMGAPPSNRGAGQPFTVGVLSRLVRHKGVHLVIEALSAVPDSRLIIGGDGPERAALRDQTERLGLSDRVTFLGWVDPDEVFGSSHVLVSAAYVEGHPMTLLDAGRRGVPVVAADTGGVADIVEHGVTGRLVPPSDAAALTRAIDRLRRDPGERVTLGRAAAERSRYGYGVADMAARYCRLYAEASGGPRTTVDRGRLQGRTVEGAR